MATEEQMWCEGIGFLPNEAERRDSETEWSAGAEFLADLALGCPVGDWGAGLSRSSLCGQPITAVVPPQALRRLDSGVGLR